MSGAHRTAFQNARGIGSPLPFGDGLGSDSTDRGRRCAPWPPSVRATRAEEDPTEGVVLSCAWFRPRVHLFFRVFPWGGPDVARSGGAWAERTTMTAIPTMKYARSADVHIAYQVVGEGAQNLVLVPGWVSHIEYACEDPSCSHFFRRLSAF